MKMFFDILTKRQPKKIKTTDNTKPKPKNGKILEVVKNFHRLTKKKHETYIDKKKQGV